MAWNCRGKLAGLRQAFGSFGLSGMSKGRAPKPLNQSPLRPAVARMESMVRYHLAAGTGGAVLRFHSGSSSSLSSVLQSKTWPIGRSAAGAGAGAGAVATGAVATGAVAAGAVAAGGAGAGAAAAGTATPMATARPTRA